MLTPTSGSRNRCPCRPETGYIASCVVLDTALDEHASGADRLGILGDERALLRERRVPARGT